MVATYITPPRSNYYLCIQFIFRTIGKELGGINTVTVVPLIIRSMVNYQQLEKVKTKNGVYLKVLGFKPETIKWPTVDVQILQLTDYQELIHHNHPPPSCLQ